MPHAYATEVWVNKSWGHDALELRLIARNPNGTCAKAKIEWIDVAELEMIEPSGKLLATDSQRLMDMLWDCGVRPTAGSGSAGSFEAVKNHLDDMKQIAFHMLKIEKK
jgi:hypothetical protein